MDKEQLREEFQKEGNAEVFAWNGNEGAYAEWLEDKLLQHPKAEAESISEQGDMKSEAYQFASELCIDGHADQRIKSEQVTEVINRAMRSIVQPSVQGEAPSVTDEEFDEMAEKYVEEHYGQDFCSEYMTHRSMFTVYRTALDDLHDQLTNKAPQADEKELLLRYLDWYHSPKYSGANSTFAEDVDAFLNQPNK